MKIFHVIESLRAGGKERQLFELLKGASQIRPGIKTWVFVMSDEVHYDVSAIEGVQIVPLIRRSKRDLSIFWRLKQFCDGLRPDVIHSWGGMCSIYAAPIAAATHTSFVNGLIRDAPPNNMWKNKDFWRGVLTYPLSQAVVGNSLAGLHAYRAPQGKSICIYNGFDRRRIDKEFDVRGIRDQLNIDTPYVVGMVASYIDRKDYDTFFAAAHLVLQSRRDVTFVSVGSGDRREDYASRISAELAPFFRVMGRRSDVELLVSAFDVGVLTSNTSLHGEGISNAIMEYMALEKPAIATDAGGTRELITEGETGYLVSDNDSAAIASLVQRLLDDESLRRSMGAAGARKIRTEFDLKTMTENYLKLYDRLAIGNMRRPGPPPSAR